MKHFEEAVKSVKQSFRLGHREDDREKEPPRKFPHPAYYDGPQPTGHTMGPLPVVYPAAPHVERPPASRP